MSENMLFCLGEGSGESQGVGYHKSYMVFNKTVTPVEFEKAKNSMPNIELPVTRWIEKKEMTEDEKENVSGWSETGGYLKTLNYEEAWAKWWSEAKQSDKDKILKCEYFDADIFKGITGIKDFGSKSLKGKKVKVELDGESYEAIIQ